MGSRRGVMLKGFGGAVTAALVAAMVAMPQAGGLPGLPADLETGWQAYVGATEAHRARTGTPTRFLVLDLQGDGRERRAVLGGDVVVRSDARGHILPPSVSLDLTPW